MSKVIKNESKFGVFKVIFARDFFQKNGIRSKIQLIKLIQLIHR